MGSLDDASADNTTQEVTLATIRSVSGDWDNAGIAFTSAAAGVSAFTSSGLFHAPASCASKGTVKIQIWGGGGSGAIRSSGTASGGRGGAYSMTLVHDITGTGHVMVDMQPRMVQTVITNFMLVLGILIQIGDIKVLEMLYKLIPVWLVFNMDGMMVVALEVTLLLEVQVANSQVQMPLALDSRAI